MTSPTMRSQPAAQQRREVEDLVGGLFSRSDELTFNEPWEIRAFALAVAAHKSGQYPWPDFQQALITSIKTWETSVLDGRDPQWSYYEHWVNALEVVLEDRGAVAPAAVDLRTLEVLSMPPNRNHHDPHFEPVAVDPAVRSCRGES